LPAADLADLWVLMMDLWANGSTEFSLQDLNDCQSEMTLRRVDPPFNRVSHTWDRIAQLSKVQIDTVLADRKLREAAEAALEEQLEQMRRLIDRQQH
jgi:hypothetical protein